MELYFIRHAQSNNNALFAETGSWAARMPDPDITATGREQAQHLARYLAQPYVPPDPGLFVDAPQRGFGLTHLYASPMRRAIVTAGYVAQALALPLAVWETLHERGGIFQLDEQDEPQGLPGADRATLTGYYPGLLLPESLDPAGWWQSRHEPREAVPGRARRFLAELRERHGSSDDRVAVFSHAGFYQSVMGALLDSPRPDTDWQDPEHVWFVLHNVGISRIDFSATGSLAIRYLNRVSFLPDELVT